MSTLFTLTFFIALNCIAILVIGSIIMGIGDLLTNPIVLISILIISFIGAIITM
jgi:hypothetical protein